jgi:carboxypeptidase C (cathepsin A)
METTATQWELFNYESPDPWLGTKPQFANVPIFQYESNHYGQMYYWLYPCQRGIDSPTIVRFAGGPGMSVMHYAFDDSHSPLHIDSKNMKFVKNENSLTKDYNLLFIESPLGSGYSTINDKLEDEIPDNLRMNLKIFEQIFDRHPQLKKQKLYLRGESYAANTIFTLAVEIPEKFPGVVVAGVIGESIAIEREINSRMAFETCMKFGVFAGKSEAEIEELRKDYGERHERSKKDGCQAFCKYFFVDS